MTDKSRINGDILISWDVPRGPKFKAALALARQLEGEGKGLVAIRDAVCAAYPKPAVIARKPKAAYGIAIAAETQEDADNIAAVRRHMDDLMRCPVLEHGAIMPDACPSGAALGTIPVGGAVVSRAIHPAFHSADICCSMYATVFPEGVETGAFMDALKASTRFGPGGRPPEHRVSDAVTDELETTRNPFLLANTEPARAQLADQGDGNHFAYLGGLDVSPALVSRLDEAGQSDLAAALAGRTRVNVLVTHHGSRTLGANVYKRGVVAAAAHTSRISPDTPPHQAWLDYDSDQGRDYWDALQYVARWTRRNHQLVHERTLARLGIVPLAAFGNEHNFVWKRGDRFFHGKGATPAWTDDLGQPQLGLIPLNMAAPILLTLGADKSEYASFSPHGAGRNKSRTQLLREQGLAGLSPPAFLERSRSLLDEQTAGLDVRFFFDRPDVSETPIAYKSARQVRAQIEHFGLAEIVAEITPKGCLMAGDYDKPWLKKRSR
jgi:hypothetical protein